MQKSRPGPPLPDGWRGLFLAYVELNGTLYKAARAAGVSDDTVRRERARDAEFDRQVEEARQFHADELEEQLRAEPGVVGRIVLLKKFKPAEYIERQSVLNLNVNTEVPPELGKELLLKMLGAATPATQAMLQGSVLEGHAEDVTPSATAPRCLLRSAG